MLRIGLQDFDANQLQAFDAAPGLHLETTSARVAYEYLYLASSPINNVRL